MFYGEIALHPPMGWSREQTVYEHLTGTAELAKQFAAAFGAEEDGSWAFPFC